VKQLLYAALAVVLCSCGVSSASHSDNVLAFNSFDEFDGWVPDGSMPSLTRDKSHSGLYSSCVSPTVEYAAGYNSTLGKLSPTRFTKMRVRAWVWLPSLEAKASLVVEVTEPGTNKMLLSEYIDVVEASGKTDRKWAELEKVVTLPAEVTSNSQFKMYLWRNQSSQPVYLDDCQLERVD
jgi:hypothetical protein